MNPKQPRRESSVKTILATLVIFMFVIILMSCTGGGVPATEFPPAVAVPENNQAPAATEAPNVSGETADSGIPVTTCDVLLPPEACNPEWESQIVYTALNTLPSEACKDRLLDDGMGLCVTLGYTNNNQDFTITVEGANQNIVMDYINMSQAYFTVLLVGNNATHPTDQEIPSLPAILVETAVEYTKLSQAELSAVRDELGELTTLADILSAITGSPEAVDNVIEGATARAISEFTAAGLSGAEIDAIPDRLKNLMGEQGTQFLYDPAIYPMDNEGHRNLLLNDPDALLITMEWTSAPAEETGDAWVIWYSIDPPISSVPISYLETVVSGKTQLYKDKCKVNQASAGIKATKGSMILHFWRYTVAPTKMYPIGTRVADIQKTAAPPSMNSAYYSTKTYFDAKVVGATPNGGTYTISGGWVQGSGCQ
jgi:hypothetical protein